MEQVKLAAQRLAEARPFAECTSVTFSPTTRVVEFHLAYPAPLDIVAVQLTPRYIECYPLGEVSMVLGNHFHVIPIGGAPLTLHELALKIRERCLAALAAANPDGPPGEVRAKQGGEIRDGESSSPDSVGMAASGMEDFDRHVAGGTVSTEWFLEPTVELNSANAEGGPGSGISPFLLADLAAASSDGGCAAPVLLKDEPALGKATVIIMLDTTNVIDRTTALAWNLWFGEPLQIRLTFDRQRYLEAPVAVQVGQTFHFETSIFHGVAGQLALIMEGFCREVVKQEAAAQSSPVEVLCQYGCAPHLAWKALELCEGRILDALHLVVHCTEEEIRSGDAALSDIEGSAAGSSSSSSIAAIKRLPPNTAGFLSRAAAYALQRLPTAPEFCVMCDQPHLFGHGGMLQASVCRRELCMFKFQELNVARDYVNAIAVQTGVVDLLLNCARAAAMSPRWEHIFDPFPIPCLNPTGVRDIATARTVLKCIPPLREVGAAVARGGIKAILDGAHPLAFATFQWAINSNKSLLVKLAPDAQMPFMGTPHQFVLATAAPSRQTRFAELKRAHGSQWAFHGSRAEHWHAILRNGLKNASGTKLQVNGAAHGAGIYLSPYANVSFGYSQLITRENRVALDKVNVDYIDPSSMHCIAICEVIEHDLKKSGQIWVQPHEDHVMARFFFVYTMGMSCGGSTDLLQPHVTARLNEVAQRFIKQ